MHFQHLLLLFYTIPTLSKHIPFLHTEKVAIQWVEPSNPNPNKKQSLSTTNANANPKHLRPMLESYTVAVVHLPTTEKQHLPIRLTCGAYLFDFNKNGTNIKKNNDHKHDTIETLAKQTTATTSPKTRVATLLLNTTHNNGRTTTHVPFNILETCKIYNDNDVEKKAIQQTESWSPFVSSSSNKIDKNTDQQAMVLLHQLSKQDMFALVAVSNTVFLEDYIHMNMNMNMQKGLPTPPDPMAEMQGILSEVGNMVKGPVEGCLKPVVKDMGEVISDTVGGVIEATLTPETSGDMNDQMIRSLVPGLTMSLVENLSPTLAQSFPDTMSEALSESLREKLTNSLSLSLEPKLVTSLTHSLIGSIDLWTTATIPHTIERGLSKVLSNMLTKSLAHSITPSLIHTLSHDATQDYYAYMCFHHKVYCQYTSYAPSQVFYASYYASYFSSAAVRL